MASHQFRLDRLQLFLQLRIFLGMEREQFPREIRKRLICRDALEQRLDCTSPGSSQPEFSGIAADRIRRFRRSPSWR